MKLLPAKQTILLQILLSLLIFSATVYGKAEDLKILTKGSRPLNILCLGDSITQSGSEYCGYRYPLWEKLVDSGIEFDFIGSMKERVLEDSFGPCPDYKGKKFDPDHEGHWGWRADHMLGIRDDFPKGSGSGNLGIWLKGYTPDIVLLHLGHNDAGMGETPGQMAEELAQVVLLLQKDNPKVSILLAKVIPSENRLWNSRLAILNAEMDGIAKRMNTPSSRVMVVDMEEGFNPLEDTNDGDHPNHTGAEKMARKWFEGILEVLKTTRNSS